tara:strand:- start:2017 stop:2289 length:273 start_codon:yes stop_codon:yes gene_type:complete
MKNDSTNSNSTEEESQGIDIYEEIRKEIQRVIDSENPNDKGQDDWEQYHYTDEERYEDINEEYYQRQEDFYHEYYRQKEEDKYKDHNPTE